MALGAQLCCGPECYEEQKRRARADRLRIWQVRSEAAAFVVVLGILGFLVALRWL
jgi:hypothetical protein